MFWLKAVLPSGQPKRYSSRTHPMCSRTKRHSSTTLVLHLHANRNGAYTRLRASSQRFQGATPARGRQARPEIQIAPGRGRSEASTASQNASNSASGGVSLLGALPPSDVGMSSPVFMLTQIAGCPALSFFPLVIVAQ
jgi:hypothetical protein